MASRQTLLPHHQRFVVISLSTPCETNSKLKYKHMRMTMDIFAWDRKGSSSFLMRSLLLLLVSLSSSLLSPSSAETADDTVTDVLCARQLSAHGITLQQRQRRRRRWDDDTPVPTTTLKITTRTSEGTWLGVGLRDLNDPFMVGSPLADGGGHDVNLRMLPLWMGRDDAGTDQTNIIHTTTTPTTVLDGRIRHTNGHTVLSVPVPSDWDRIYIASGPDNAMFSGEPALVLSVSRLTNDPDDDCVVDVVVTPPSQNTISTQQQQRQEQRQLQNRSTANQNVWKAHGLLMTIAWGLLIPLAVTASFIRNLLSDGSWFHLHRTLNALAVLCVVTAFVLAFYAVHQEDDRSHFRETDHRAIGVAVVFVVMIQAVLACARPQGHLERLDVPSAPSPPPENKDPSPPATDDDDVVEPPQREERLENGTAVNRNGNGNDDEEIEVVEMTNGRKFWELQHRLVGMCLIGLCWYNIHRGIDLYEDRFGDIIDGRSTTAFYWAAMIGFVLSVFVLVTVARSFTP